MKAERKEFVVVAFGDRDGYGYDEDTLPILLRPVESSSPATHRATHLGVISFFLPSSRSLAAVFDLVSAAETLRDGDSRFASLGIGVSRGPLIAEFDWRGRVRHSTMPLGETANRASAGVTGLQNYRETLDTWHDTATV